MKAVPRIVEHRKVFGGTFEARWLPALILLASTTLWAASACSGEASGGRVSERRGSIDPAQMGPEMDAAIDAALYDNRDAGSDVDVGAMDAASVDAAPADAASADATLGEGEVAGCGDGIIQAGERCDDGNNAPGDGCASDCSSVEQTFACPMPGEPCISTVECGDGRVSGTEECDDGNTRSGDGCDAECHVEPGAVCAGPGARCFAAECGDGLVAGDEACDDGLEPADGDGCSALCKVEPGFVCGAGEGCRATVCNDGVREGSEPCDDGNQVVGDGCTPFCEVEPDCGEGACRSRCGDGLILPADDEECDDGNTADHDGCSAACRVEKGYRCILEMGEPPDLLAIPVTLRDFISKPAVDATRHPDFEAFSGGDVTPGLVQDLLGVDGKPVYNHRCDDASTTDCPRGQQLTTAVNFDQWYRDAPEINVSKVVRMTLARDSDTGAYVFSNGAFFPWDDDAASWVGQGNELKDSGHNFGFTSEIHYFFEYEPGSQAPPTLTFLGDDDVWVFINHRLAVDIGGVHPEAQRSVTLDPTEAERLGLVAGELYEIALFHAERHTSKSRFNLTLDGFVRARSVCASECGDGIVAGDEDCDDGINDGSYGSCTTDCRRGPHCGDGVVQEEHERCDDGVNLTGHADGKGAGCAPGCVASAYCGDGHVDSLFGEECDEGDNPGGYGRCSPECKLGPRCGDTQMQRDEGEECDDGDLVRGDGCSDTCQLEGPS